jgi:cell division protein FtsW (lipid II flippase)
MTERRKLEFIPQTHTDFIFQIESHNRVVHFLARLIKPVAYVLLRIWFFVRYRRPFPPWRAT